MGLLSCRLSSPRDKKHDLSSNTNSHLRSESSSSFSASFSSQPSLPSVPSLIPQPTHLDIHLSFPTTAHHRISTLKAHSSPVFSLSVAGNFLFTGSSDDQIRLWNRSDLVLPQANESNVVAIGNGAVKSLVVSGDKLFSAHQDSKIRVWKIYHKNPFSHYKCIAVLPTLTDRVHKLFSSESYVKVRRHKTCTWVHHVDAVSALAISKDGSVLYSASWDRTFKVWRATDFKCLESIWNAHDDAINAIAVTNECIFTGSADKKIKVWKKKKQVEEKSKKKKKKQQHVLVATLEKHKSAVNALALSKDGNFLYSGACDRSILVWKISEEEEEEDDVVVALAGALRGHTKAILCLVSVEDLIASGSADKTVRIWRRSEEIGRRNNNDCCYCCLAVLEGHRGPVKCLAACVESCGDDDNNSRRRNHESSAGTPFLIYSGGLDCDISVWRAWVPGRPT